MKKVLAICVLALTFLSDCSMIHFFSVSEKEHENMESANLYLSKLSIDSSFSYQISKTYLDSLNTERYAINIYKLQHGTPASPVQLRMYDNTGKFIYGWSQCFGSITKLHILDSLPFKHTYWLPVNFNLSFQYDINLININENEKNKLIRLVHEFDYTIIVFWAEWTGWYSKDVLKKIYKYVAKHNEKKIFIIKLNTSP